MSGEGEEAGTRARGLGRRRVERREREREREQRGLRSAQSSALWALMGSGLKRRIREKQACIAEIAANFGSAVVRFHSTKKPTP